MIAMHHLSYIQAERNMSILYEGRHNLQVDESGNLSFIPWYNIPKKIFVWILDFLDGGNRIHRVYQAVLATFNKLNQEALLNPASPRWTCRYLYVKPFDIGFDKVSINLLADRQTFCRSIHTDSWICSRIRDAAFNTLLWSGAERKKSGMTYGQDHLPDEIAFRIHKEDPDYFRRLP